MSNGNARREANPHTIEANSPVLIDSRALSKKDCLHILHVDDDLYLLEVSKQILSMENNFEIEDAASVDEAFQKLERQTYDAIVSDYEMPQKNGLDFLKELRQQQREISFILFTGKGREDVAVKALNLGADSYINKNGSTETVYCELADAINKTVERKKAKSLLVESEAKYRMLVEESLQGIMIAQGMPPRIVFANSAMGRMLGYAGEEFTSLSPQEVMALVSSEDREMFFNRFRDRLMGKQRESSYDFRAVRKDGSILWMQASSNRIQYNGEPAVQAMFLDIDERKKADETIRKSEERYRELANSLPEIVFDADTEGKLTFFNKRAFEITGFTQQDFDKGLNAFQLIVPEDRERARNNLKKLFAGENFGPNEYKLARKDGTVFTALIKTARVILENKVCGFRGLAVDVSEMKSKHGNNKISER
ncbi:MAG: PAS domain S-box protein [Candidatus Bathyarchaeia archaeon]|jgi:PAS domain S-box-containing protein